MTKIPLLIMTLCSILMLSSPSFAEEIIQQEIKNYQINTSLKLAPIHGRHHEKSSINDQNGFIPFYGREIKMRTDSVLLSPHFEYSYKNNFYLQGGGSFSLSHTSKNSEHSENGRLSDTPQNDLHSSFETKNEVRIYSITAGHHFDFKEIYLQFGPFAGFDYQDYFYKLGRFQRDYPQSDLSSHKGVMRDNMSYRLTYLTPFAGGDISFISNYWKIKLEGRYSPIVRAKGKDSGIIRTEDSQSRYKGKMVGGNLSVERRFKQDIFLTLFYDYQTMNLKGEGQLTSQRESKSTNLQQTLTNYHFQLGLQVGYLF